MLPQRKLMIVETTHAFVKLKQIKAAGQPDCRRHKFLNSKIYDCQASAKHLVNLYDITYK